MAFRRKAISLCGSFAANPPQIKPRPLFSKTSIAELRPRTEQCLQYRTRFFRWSGRSSRSQTLARRQKRLISLPESSVLCRSDSPESRASRRIDRSIAWSRRRGLRCSDGASCSCGRGARQHNGLPQSPQSQCQRKSRNPQPVQRSPSRLAKARVSLSSEEELSMSSAVCHPL
jgi:hypothetical protein